MLKNNSRALGALAVASLLVLPATAQADHKAEPHGKGKGNAKGKSKGQAKRCAKAPKVGVSVKGTLVTFTADDPNTAANEASVTLNVTKANSHARKSGDFAATYTVNAADDAFRLKLSGYEGTDTPSAGDKVKLNGKVALTKAKCAAEGTSTADRYAKPDVRKVKVSDRDPDQP